MPIKKRMVAKLGAQFDDAVLAAAQSLRASVILKLTEGMSAEEVRLLVDGTKQRAISYRIEQAIRDRIQWQNDKAKEVLRDPLRGQNDKAVVRLACYISALQWVLDQSSLRREAVK